MPDDAAAAWDRLLKDLDGLHRLQTMQLTLLRQVRAEVQRLRPDAK